MHSSACPKPGSAREKRTITIHMFNTANMLTELAGNVSNGGLGYTMVNMTQSTLRNGQLDRNNESCLNCTAEETLNYMVSVYLSLKLYM